MASYRKENLWVTPSKRTYDNLPKSAVRGYSNIASRINYSRNKVEQPTYSNISSKKVGGKQQISKDDPYKGNILNDRQNTNQYSANHLIKLK